MVKESTELWGSVAGNVRVTRGVKFYMRGAVYGDLTIEAGGRCHVFGNVSGNLIVHEDTKVIHSGVVGKDIINEGGRLVVEAISKVMGKVRTKSGETKLEGPHRES